MPLKDSLKTLTDLADTSIFVKTILVLWLVCSLLAFTMLNRIDSIVHNKLYDFGLHFSLAWASPYWIALRLTYILLAIPSTLSIAVLTYDLWRWKSNNKKHTPKRKHKSTEPQSIHISCPSCKRVFTKPLVLLDYPHGKARLVNACPYCNAILKDADQKNNHVETRVLEPPKQQT